jgi:acetylornithine deacetylase/succinyl-diaminopimelate desuccinylase-like protein
MRIPEQWLDELGEFLRIPSVSADPSFAADVRAAAEWVCGAVRRAGGGAEVVETARNPLAVGEVRASGPYRDGAPTVLVYGHFDVQPAGSQDLWISPPFEPSVRDGWLYARGAADDKGNLYLLLKAVELLAGAGELPVNVRIACDGEEEVVGESIVEFLRADERGAAACLIFDGSMPRRDVPFFFAGTRGLVFLHLRIRTGAHDLHSGFYGGAALNASHALAEVLAAVVPMPEELNDGAVPPSEEELAALRELDSGTEVLASQGATPSDQRAAEEFYARTLASAALDVNGLKSGEAELQKTVLPVEAEANLSIRVAPGQDADAIAQTCERLLREAVPPGAEIEIERWSTSPPGLVPTDALPVRLAIDAFERVLGRRPLLVRCGGTLPVVPALVERGIPPVHTGFDVPEGNVHAPNERLLCEYVPVGVEAARETLWAFAALPM